MYLSFGITAAVENVLSGLLAAELLTAVLGMAALLICASLEFEVIGIDLLVPGGTCHIPA